jgi:hypothetical protein
MFSLLPTHMTFEGRRSAANGKVAARWLMLVPGKS